MGTTMKTGTKLFVAISLLLVIAIAVFGTATYASSRKALEERILEQMRTDFAQRALRLRPMVESIAQDVLFLTEIPAALSMLRGRQGIDATCKVVAKNSSLDEDNEVRLERWRQVPSLGARVKRAGGTRSGCPDPSTPDSSPAGGKRREQRPQL
jgi:hypothetical protein